MVRDHGLSGLAIATFCCGALQMATGALKLGGIVKLTPAPVMTGFMTGIGAPCCAQLTLVSITNCCCCCGQERLS
jgi:MFS superfamily sulfate permease-like transporter